MTKFLNLDTNTEFLDGNSFLSPNSLRSSSDESLHSTIVSNTKNMSPLLEDSLYSAILTPLSNSNMSPLSTSSAETSYHFQHLNLGHENNNNNGPYLFITEQPIEKFRFRYKSEMHGTHGSLTGHRTEKSKKSFPTVELRNYNGEAIIRCSLYQNNSFKKNQHSHSLVVKKGNEDFRDPHDVIVSQSNGYVAVFQGMGIIHTAKKFIADELHKKLIEKRKFETNELQLTPLEEAKLKNQAEQESKTMNLNQVVLCFEAFTKSIDSTFIRICEPVFSTPINNMKSALTGELKISRLSSAVSKADGGDDLFLFVEKVGKKNIKVRFYELNDCDEEIWQDWGRFSEADVHHQYAIALRTPPYRDIDIESHRDVYIQLYRPSDYDTSEPVKFRYKPRNCITGRKRPRMNSNLSSSEIPAIINEQFNNNINNNNNNNNNIINNNNNNFNNIDNNNQQCNTIQTTTQPIMGVISDHRYDNTSEQITDLNLNSDDFKFNSDYLKYKSDDLKKFTEMFLSNPDEIMNYCEVNDKDFNKLVTDGISIKKSANNVSANNTDNLQIDNLRKMVILIKKFGKENPEKTKSLISYIFQECNIKGASILHACIKNDNKNLFNKYLDIIDNLKLHDILQLQNEYKETCLHTACLNNKSEYIKRLLQIGINPNLTDIRGDTALHIAVQVECQLCVTYLVDKHNYLCANSKIINIDLLNDDGLTAIHIAVKKRNLNICKLLISAGAAIDIKDSKSGNNVLHIAVDESAIDICKYILTKTKLNINDKNTSGYTPLELAICSSDMSSNKEEIEKLLLQHMVKVPSSHMNVEEKNVLQSNIKLESQSEHNSQQNEYATDFNNDQLFDDVCLQKLYKIFNLSDNWKQLAVLLDLDVYTHIWGVSDNPAKMLFNFVEIKGINFDDIITIFTQLESTAALDAVNEMVARRLEEED